MKFASKSPAAPAAGQLLTLKEALQKGISYSQRLKQAQSNLNEVKAEYKSYEAKIFPTVNGIGSAVSTKNPNTFTGQGYAPIGTIEQYTAAVQVKQPLYSGGAVVSGLSYAKVREDISKQGYINSKQDVVQELINAYFNAAQLQINLELAQDNRSVLKSYFDITSKYASIGRSKNIDRLQAEASYALSESEVLQIESDYEKAIGELQRLLGEKLPEKVKLQNDFATQPVETGSYDQLLDRSLKNNPALKTWELAVKEQGYSKDLNMAIHKPTLNLEGAWGYRSPDRPNWFEESSNYYTVGLYLTIPLFSGLSSVADRHRYSERIFRAERDLTTFQDALRKDVLVSLSTIKRDFNRVKYALIAAQSARRAMDSALRDYRSGLVSSTDVITVQSNRYRADQQYSAALFSYQREVVALRRLLGVDLESTYENL